MPFSIENMVKFANITLKAPDITVGGQIIGQTSDGQNYLRFLTVLKQKLGTKSVSIAAPASYWYLKAFPIDRIAAVIDYIVYMTYDLHGQCKYNVPLSRNYANALRGLWEPECLRFLSFGKMHSKPR
jgi:hypothetical protein